jgi:predicted nucleic acid-binding protein
MTYCADSTFVVDCLTHQLFTRPLLPNLLRAGLALSFIVHTELWDGLYHSRDPKRAARELRTFLRRVMLLSFSKRVSLRTAQLRHEMRARNLILNHRQLDILIAGTALTYDLVMVTSDVDYDDIPGLTILNPRTGQTRQNPA